MLKKLLISVSILSLNVLVSFPSLKWFLTSLMMFSSLALGSSIIISYEKKVTFLKIWKSIMILKKQFDNIIFK